MTAAHILVVEDAKRAALNLRRKLERVGYAVVGVAVTGEEAIHTALSTHPDLVLLDIHLRGNLDGIETAKRIRSYLDIPVIYLSAYADHATIARATITEPCGYLRQPCTAHELEAAIELALHKHQAGRAAAISGHSLPEQPQQPSLQQLRDSATYLHRLQEAERAHLAREIHDELAQFITGLHMDTAWLSQQLVSAPSAVRERLHAMTELTKTLGASVRRIATALRPQILDDLGLLSAIDWLLHDAQKRAGLRYTLTPPSDDISLDEARTTSVFRIVQEALTNVLRHAEAQHVAIRIMQEPDVLVVEISDDGKGITAAQLTQPDSFGIVGMRERARLWGGDVTLQSAPGSGTLVSVRIPCR